MKNNLSLFYKSQKRGNVAIKTLPSVLLRCHNDMESKNVLRKGNDFRIIDFESLCYSNPYLALYQLALCWTSYERCGIDFNLFNAFLRAYINAGGTLPTDWKRFIIVILVD